MTALMTWDLPYREGAYWLSQLRTHVWPMLLESGRVEATSQQHAISEELMLGTRFDIVVADPVVKLVTQASQTWQTSTLPSVCIEQEISTTDPFALIHQWLMPHAVARTPDIPFAGGALGYFAYDLGRSLERLPTVAAADATLPDMLVGIYDWAIVVDHHLRRCRLVSHGRFLDATALQQLYQQLQSPLAAGASDAGHFQVTGKIAYNLPPLEYAQAFAAVKNYISAGDCYQVNLAQRFSVAVSGDAWQAYDAFRTLSRAPFMAYILAEDRHARPLSILSMSPERFLQVSDGQVETRPIKGTRPRHADPLLDAEAAQQLAASSKDRAENLMIVDLLRNDIGKVCEVGSVKVEALFQLQRFSNVHHLVSIIRGRLAAGMHALDLLRGCFPGGSITGAPKLRAMEIIEALEPHRRHVYCGSIAYIGFDGCMDSNIAIRTAVVHGDQMTFYAGGGVVADSDADKEYQETLDKASQFFKLVARFQATTSSERR